MTIRELIEKLEGIENQNKKINWIWEQYNPSTDMWDMWDGDFTGEEWENDREISILLSPRLNNNTTRRTDK